MFFGRNNLKRPFPIAQYGPLCGTNQTLVCFQPMAAFTALHVQTSAPWAGSAPTLQVQSCEGSNEKQTSERSSVGYARICRAENEPSATYWIPYLNS
ncbi:hypothetical protein BCF46_1773 [Litoreibacter meonggei]|uniref:Uncharacterized protein n=1 Tax=Litoreibacter meonggei TaxID=1049199 RepID=A0A497WNM9_9RHOB|nr:hypothetical protein BCF46_1773 [Litoreibacter meonggei]